MNATFLIVAFVYGVGVLLSLGFDLLEIPAASGVRGNTILSVIVALLWPAVIVLALVISALRKA